jgi:hypothetical protein
VNVRVPPGEEALYNWIGSVLEAAAKDPKIMQTLKETAVQAERELIDPYFQWRNNGRAAGNGWNSPVDGAKWGTDYSNRTGTAKSNMYDNSPQETKYIYTDDDSAGKQLNGQNNYTITFAKVPPVKGDLGKRSAWKRRNGLFAPVSLFIRTHNETLSVVAMRVSNPDRSPVGINR